MKAKAFLTELENISLWLEKKSESLSDYYEYLGFYPGIDPQKTAEAFRRGWWSTFIFSHDMNAIFGMRILPEKPYEAWSVVRNFENYAAVTCSNSLKNFIPFQQVFALSDKTVFNTVSRDWEIIMRLHTPLFSLFGLSPEYMDYIKEYAFTPENMPTGNKQEDVIRYLGFWNHYDKSEGHKILRDMITMLNKDEEWLPDTSPAGDLGIWETRIKNILMSQAKTRRVIYGNEKVKDFIINGFLQPHGYDVDHIVFQQNPSSTSSKTLISSIVGYFPLVVGTLPETFLKSHFYKAALEIDNNFNGYQGEEHYQAALVLESDGKPLEAWNALVSASYWAGVNGDPDGVEKHWQKAIEICEKQNWVDALDTLTTQWDWYQDYKLKNQL